MTATDTALRDAASQARRAARAAEAAEAAAAAAYTDEAAATR